MKRFIFLLAIVGSLFAFTASTLYPIDGYNYSGIKRLVYWQLVKSGEIKTSRSLPEGAYKSFDEIQLNLRTQAGDSAEVLMQKDPEFQKEIERLFRNMSSHYSLAVMDLTDSNKLRFAETNPKEGYQPGSVGKLAVLTGFFTQLAKIYPDSYEKRLDLLRTKKVKAGKWGVGDHHTIPVYDMENKKLVKRHVQADDEFTLFEWIDHMVSVSNNGAASTVWREALLMAGLGKDYPTATEEQRQAFLEKTPSKDLGILGHDVVNQPLRDLGITKDDWRLGSFFTHGAKSLCRVTGGSRGTSHGLMKWLINLEQGKIVDKQTSLEMKRLIFMTDRRIRYAASPKLKEAAVYFKSGSLYKCDKSKDSGCGKYKGNVYNYMNSVAIVEHSDNHKYMVVLMSNVKGKNSAWDHLTLASNIDDIIKKKDQE